MNIMKHLHKPCILLTTTVNVNTNINYMYQKHKQHRLNTYLIAIRKWLSYTSLPIVIVENSGYTFPELTSPRLEVITFDADQYDYTPKNSKGIHEAFSVLYALQHSSFLNKCSHFIKITGRYYIPSFEKVLYSIPYSCNAIRQQDSYRCEVVGCSKNIASFLFQLPMTIHGKMDTHVENVYKHRIEQCTNVITLPVLKIHPTSRGGIKQIYYSL
jgi:hypothetical protein